MTSYYLSFCLGLLPFAVVAQTKPVIKQAATEKPASAKRIVYTYVEQMPKYPNGNSGVLRYIANNVRLPEEVKTGKREGKVRVTFEIDEQGKVQHPTILIGLSPATNEEALRVVRAMPNWIPGRSGGMIVPVYMTVPVTFSLKPQEIPDHDDPNAPNLNSVGSE